MSRLRLLRIYVPRSLARGGRRALVTVLCIAVGVMAVVALQVASLSVGDALTANVRAANGGDVSLTSNSAPLSSTDLKRFESLQRAGSISTWTAVSRVHATATTAAGLLIPFDAQVVDTGRYPVGGQPAFVEPAGGRVAELMRGRGDVLVSSVLAQELGARLGDSLAVHGVGGSGLRATVRGILAQATLEHAAEMFVSRADERSLTSASPQYVSAYANVSGDPGAPAAELQSAFPQATVRTVADALRSADQQVHDFHTYALVAGLVALLVAGVGIQNAMQSMLASRIGEVAMLKALGNRPRAVGGLFAAEAGLLGLAGGLVGTAVGILASSAVTTSVARATGIQATPHLDAAVVLQGVSLGVAATILFSLLPILGAAAVRPLGLMRGELPPVRRSAPAYAGLFLLVVTLFAALAAYVTGDVQVSVYLVIGGVTVCGALSGLFAGVIGGLARLPRPDRRGTAAVIAAALAAATALAGRFSPALVPLVLFALLTWAGLSLAPTRLRLWLLMAARSLDRRRARTAVTLVALFAGALAGGLTMTMASGLREQIAQAIAANGSVNLIAIGSEASRDDLLRNAARLPGIQTSQATTIAPGRAVSIDGRPTPIPPPVPGAEPGEGRIRELNGVTGYDLASGAQPPAIAIREGRGLSAADAGGNNVLVAASLSRSPALVHPGSKIALADAGSGHELALNVVGLYQRAGPRSLLTGRYSPAIYGDTLAAQRLAGGNAQTVLSLTVAPQYLDADSVALQRADPSALVANLNDLTAVVRNTLNNLLLVLTVITGMVVLAGVAVIGNGVTLALIERAREVALLKAVGFGPRHVLTLVLMEYGLVGFLAAAGAVVFIAAALAILSSRVLQAPIAFSIGISALLVLVCLAITVVTAWLTARRGAWARPFTALRNA